MKMCSNEELLPHTEQAPPSPPPPEDPRGAWRPWQHSGGETLYRKRQKTFATIKFPGADYAITYLEPPMRSVN